MKIIFTSLLLFATLISYTQSVSKYICVDQFGYRPSSDKVAVIRDPQTGWDASESFTPGSTYKVINASTGASVFQGSPTAWNGGATHDQSGDRCWWFDFSSVTTPGSYYILDVSNNVKSYTFDINTDVYKTVLKHAVRMLYYQRRGFAKTATYAGAGWVDGASHSGNLQDKNCRLYSDKNNAATEKDLSGGWFDAGDLNKYTPWTAGYCYQLASAYRENPLAFTDDYNIPESGNGIPDILDETKWGLDFLLRMQQTDGSCLCIVGGSNACPPSSGTEQSLYGPATTNATYCCAAGFAMAAITFASIPSMKAYSDQLKAAAIKAWAWAQANPGIIFHNNSSANNSSGLGAGDQETDDDGHFGFQLRAAVALFAATNDVQYKTHFENNYKQLPLFKWTNFVDQYRYETQDFLMFYTTVSGASPAVVSDIKTTLATAFNKTGNYIDAYKTKADPYRGFIHDYAWGSNAYKGSYGTQFYDMYLSDLEPANSAAYKKNAEEYIHYIHGLNPLNYCYLTNMSSYGAEKSITQIYHTWFADGNSKWDQVGVSTYGPPPGYLSGGANPGYSKDACCTGNCSSQSGCSLDVSKIVGQPAMKSYLDFNTNWPANSWSVTEPSCGYQVEYIRLLSKFVSAIDTKCAYPSLGADTSICGRSSIALNTKLGAASKTFKWYKDGVLITGAASNTYPAISAGVYMVEVDTNGCKKTDEIKVNGSLSVYLGTDVILCSTVSVTLDAGNAAIPNVQYLWNTKETTRTITASKAGSYIVTVSAQNCATAKDTLIVTSKLLDVADATICPSQTATLSVNGTSTYEWYSASTGGTALASGKTFATSPSQTTTYFVGDAVGTQYTLGITDSVAGEKWSMSGTYLTGSDKLTNLTVLQPVMLQSLVVYLSAAGDVTLNIVQGATVFRTKTITGLGKGKQTLNLNLDIPAGSYIINLEGSTASILFSAAGASFPYTVAGVASMTYNESWQSAWYGYYYDIKLSTGNSCARTPVTVTVVDTCAKPVTQTIALASGWNLISTNVRPVDSAIVTIFKGLSVVEIKNMDAFWRTGQNDAFNSLKTITPGNGYFVKMNNTETLTIAGIPMSTLAYSPISTSSWTLIGCPFQSATPFSDNFNLSNCSVIKNFSGFWKPGGTINSIESFEPGKGYYIRK